MLPRIEILGHDTSTGLEILYHTLHAPPGEIGHVDPHHPIRLRAAPHLTQKRKRVRHMLKHIVEDHSIKTLTLRDALQGWIDVGTLRSQIGAR